MGFIKDWINSIKKSLKKHAGIILGASLASAAALGAYLLTLPASTSATVIYVAASVLATSVGSTVFSAGVLIGDSGQEEPLSPYDPIVNARLRALETSSQLQQTQINSVTSGIRSVQQGNRSLNEKVNNITTEQTKLSNTLSASSVNLSRVEISTNEKFKKLETRSDSFDERLSDLDEDVKALSKKIKSSLQALGYDKMVFLHMSQKLMMKQISMMKTLICKR